MARILEVNNLRTVFDTSQGEVIAIDDISFYINDGEMVGIVGESGSGKSITSLSIIRLIPTPPGRIASGEVKFMDQDLFQLSESSMRKLRGNEISMIFQEPMTSLNPVYTIGRQIDEALLLHRSVSKKEARERTIELLDMVGIPRSEELVHEYPHKLSGGMRQRVMIAMAMACEPKLLIADEPTTALDVTIQAQILQLMKDLQQEKGLSVMLITHDLGVVAETCQRVIVMYAGQIVEEATVKNIFLSPKHPYTVGLMKSIPKLSEEKEYLESIPGQVPGPFEFGKGCRFSSRCYKAEKKCFDELPPLIFSNTDETHRYRCWFPEKEE